MAAVAAHYVVLLGLGVKLVKRSSYFTAITTDFQRRDAKAQRSLINEKCVRLEDEIYRRPRANALRARAYRSGSSINPRAPASSGWRAGPRRARADVSRTSAAGHAGSACATGRPSGRTS